MRLRYLAQQAKAILHKRLRFPHTARGNYPLSLKSVTESQEIGFFVEIQATGERIWGQFVSTKGMSIRGSLGDGNPLDSLRKRKRPFTQNFLQGSLLELFDQPAAVLQEFDFILNRHFAEKFKQSSLSSFVSYLLRSIFSFCASFKICCFAVMPGYLVRFFQLDIDCCDTLHFSAKVCWFIKRPFIRSKTSLCQSNFLLISSFVSMVKDLSFLLCLG